MQLQVFDRWGELMFETTNPSDAWDGKYKGKQLDPAAFVYVLDIQLIGEQESPRWEILFSDGEVVFQPETEVIKSRNFIFYLEISAKWNEWFSLESYLSIGASVLVFPSSGGAANHVLVPQGNGVKGPGVDCNALFSHGATYSILANFNR